jgi:hypothetical protein
MYGNRIAILTTIIKHCRHLGQAPLIEPVKPERQMDNNLVTDLWSKVWKFAKTPKKEEDCCVVITLGGVGLSC